MTDNDFTTFLSRTNLATWNRMIVITGMPGARMDFLAGWLSVACPEKMQNLAWKIYPGWGRSTISPQWHWNNLPTGKRDFEKFLTNNIPLQNFLNTCIEEQYDSAALTSITTSHIPSWLLSKAIPEQHLDKFIFIDILMNDKESQYQIEWESFVKNILFSFSVRNKEIARQVMKNSMIVSGDDGRDLLKYYENLEITIKNLCWSTHPDSNITIGKSLPGENVNWISLDYRYLTDGNGHRDLIDHFNINEQHAVKVWKQCSPLAKSHTEIWCQERWWKQPRP